MQWLLQDAFNALVLVGIVAGIALIGLVYRLIVWAVSTPRRHVDGSDKE